MTYVVRAHDFSLQYPYADQPTLRHLSLHLKPGERVLLLGPSGSGKSSLALCLNGLIPHSVEADVRGSMQVFGRETRDLDPAALARRVGMVFQDPESQFCTLTVEDEIAFGLENLGVARDEMARRIDGALQQVAMAAERGTRLDRLSGGMKQRVVLAAALAMEPDLMILDEATSNLDPAGAADLFALVQRIARAAPHRAFLMIEHRLDALINIISRVWVLGEDGCLIYDAPPRALFLQHRASLDELGVWQPTVTSLAQALQEAGVAPPLPWLTLDEALAWLRQAPQAWETAAEWAQPGADAAVEPHSIPVLELEHVSYTYRTGAAAVRDVNLVVRRGEVLAVVGSNGAGKSTLAHLMIGLIHPQQGTVRVLSRDSAHTPLSTLAGLCGFVFQNPEHQFVTDCVFDEIAMGVRAEGLDEETVRQRTCALLRQLHLADKETANPFTLSQGQKRRLSVATMLTGARHILILDEPTFGQDAYNSQELTSMLRQLNRAGVTVILVTHDMELVWSLAQRVAVMADGRLLKVDTPTAIFANRDLLRQARLQPPARAVVAYAVKAMAAHAARYPLW